MTGTAITSLYWSLVEFDDQYGPVIKSVALDDQRRLVSKRGSTTGYQASKLHWSLSKRAPLNERYRLIIKRVSLMTSSDKPSRGTLGRLKIGSTHVMNCLWSQANNKSWILLDDCVQPNTNVIRKWGVMCNSWHPILKQGVMKSYVKLITSHVVAKRGQKNSDEWLSWTPLLKEMLKLLI
jgi:hypothetical protein